MYLKDGTEHMQGWTNLTCRFQRNNICHPSIISFRALDKAARFLRSPLPTPLNFSLLSICIGYDLNLACLTLIISSTKFDVLRTIIINVCNKEGHFVVVTEIGESGLELDSFIG